jgi:hypothetical protein
MLKISTLRRMIAGLTVTAGLLAAAAPATAAPVMVTPGGGGLGGGPRLEAYTLTTSSGLTRTCTPSASLTHVYLFNNFGTPSTVTLLGIVMDYDAYCSPNGGSSLSLKAPMPGSVNAGVYTFSGPGFNATGNIITTNPSAPAVPPVVGVWTNNAAPDGASRLKFNNVLIGYTDAGGTDPVRLTATIKMGTDFANTAVLAPRP